MATSDIYVVTLGSSGVSAGTTSATSTSSLIMTVKGSTAVRLWVVGIRIGVLSAGGSGQVYFGLFRANNTPGSSGASAVTPQTQDPAAPSAAVAGWSAYSGSSGWATVPTVAAGTALWEQTLPATTGSAWEEFPPTGYEWNLPVQSGGTGWLCMQAFTSATSATVTCDLVVSQ